MRLLFVFLFLLLSHDLFATQEQDLYPYVGMPLVCRFEHGRFEGVIKTVEPDAFSTNHSYTFSTTHRIELDHRIRQFRMDLSEEARHIENINRNFVNQHCKSALRDRGLLIRIMGRSGFREGDSVDCQGIRSMIQELRVNDLLLLEDEYIFHQEDCQEIDASELADLRVNDQPRRLAPESLTEPLPRSQRRGSSRAE